MEPTTPNDLAFFYLYDYTTPSRRRFHNRRHTCPASSSTSPQLHLEKAATRRTHYLEAKKARLALHNANIRHVLAHSKLSTTTEKRLEQLLDRMARADGNRDRLLKLTAENCGRRVEEAKIKARRVKKEREMATRAASREILERLENAERRREELLSARGRRLSAGSQSPGRRTGITRVEAATKIQRVWRQRRIAKAVKEFHTQRISVESVTKHSFEQVVGKFKLPATVRASARLLHVLGLVDMSIGEKEVDGVVRTFLSSFMILGHTTEVLHSHDQPIEMVHHNDVPSNAFQDLTRKAREFLTAFETHIGTLRKDSILLRLWENYLSAFRSWKAHDASILVEMLVGKFVDLDLMLLDIQDSSSMEFVVAEYSEGIKSGQMLLLSKIRRLIGDDTRNVVRKAVQAGRRRRTRSQQESSVSTIEAAPQQVQVEIIEPPTSSGHGLSNRRIMHELALDPEYEIPHPTKTDEQRLQEERFKSAFYASLLSSIQNNDQSLIPTVVSDVKARLLSLLQPNTPSYTSLSEHLDETIVNQQCQRGIFDIQKFLDYVLNTMRQLCAPIRDADVSAIAAVTGSSDAETFVLQSRKITEVLGLMGLDSANFHLRLARPALIAQATQYERTKFAEEVESGGITLSKTTTWLETVTQRIINEQTTQDSPTPIQIYLQAFINLLFSDEEIPETFSFDDTRITTLRIQLKEIVTLAALVLISKTFTAGNTSRPQNYTALSARLKVIQNDSADNILAEMSRFIGNPALKRDLLLNMIKRVKTDARDPCVVLLERRLRTVLLNVLAGGEVNGLASVGLGEVEMEVKEVAGLVKSLGRINWDCYQGWYEDITREFMRKGAEVSGNRELA